MYCVIVLYNVVEFRGLNVCYWISFPVLYLNLISPSNLRRDAVCSVYISSSLPPLCEIGSRLVFCRYRDIWTLQETAGCLVLSLVSN